MSQFATTDLMQLLYHKINSYLHLHPFVNSIPFHGYDPCSYLITPSCQGRIFQPTIAVHFFPHKTSYQEEVENCWHSSLKSFLSWLNSPMLLAFCNMATRWPLCSCSTQEEGRRTGQQLQALTSSQ